MQTGIVDRTYETRKEYWVVRGFSKRSNCYVYPNHGWSYTSWTRTVGDTYDTLEQARRGIQGGYIEDMIETQQVVDIEFLHYKRVRQIAEHVEVFAFRADGEPSTLATPTVVVENWTLRPDDYIGIGSEDNSDVAIYGRVTALRDGKAYIDVINGGWIMVVRMDGDQTVIDAESGCCQGADEGEDTRVGRPVRVLFQGVPDPHQDPECYTTQMDAWRDQQEAKGA
ncbi:hypothetical protein HOU02_gp237 [Caulobacter phage CcrBL9]|uniref:Uncharacterized protein n=1 Tax=Caulobacter phage CcrBL9 TaxID=2283270 RepID=A0A385EFE4_9CAUD|nr:hypothetical protein HOU02_gp237 [Caulobacter phage CcrBL9]AXQ69488.1 hypothetical protein CcrBL9_gp464 [Caulobacter phage CcrBL9]